MPRPHPPYPLAPTDIPVLDLTNRRFTVACERCARLKTYSYDEFVALTGPHRNEYADEIARRFRCAPGRYNGRTCPVVIRTSYAA